MNAKKKNATYATQRARTGNIPITANPPTVLESRIINIFGPHGTGLSITPEIGVRRSVNKSTDIISMESSE